MPLKNAVQRHYDALASRYEDVWPEYNQAQIDWVAKHWPQGDVGSVLDLGCGTGLMLARAAHLSPDVALTGVDASTAMLEKAAVHVPDATLIQGDLENRLFTDNLAQADIVLSLSVMHHIENIDAYLSVLDRMTYAGGTVFLSAFAKNGVAMHVREWLFRLWHPYHHRSLSHAELLQLLRERFGKAYVEGDVLRLERFWRVQVFVIRKGGG